MKTIIKYLPLISVMLFLPMYNVLANVGDAVVLTNPLGDGVTLQLFIGKIIKGILGITGSLALAMFVYGGFSWMTSAGNPAGVKKGKETMTYAAMGLAIIFSSYTLVKFVLKVVGAQ